MQVISYIPQIVGLKRFILIYKRQQNNIFIRFYSEIQHQHGQCGLGKKIDTI